MALSGVFFEQHMLMLVLEYVLCMNKASDQLSKAFSEHMSLDVF